MTNDNYMPWAHPAPEALLFAPLSLIPYRAAFIAWSAINLVLLSVTAFLLKSDLKQIGSAGVYAILAVAALPVVTALIEGQDSVLTLLLYVLALKSLRRSGHFLAGCMLGLAMIRFQLTVPVLLFFISMRCWRILLGAVSVAAGLIGVSFAIVGSSCVPKYVQMARYVAVVRDSADFDHMPTLRGFVMTLFGGRTHATLAVILLSASFLAAALAFSLCSRVPRSFACLGLQFSLAIVVALVTDYHGFVYDLVLTTIPAALLIQESPKASFLLWMLSTAELAVTFLRLDFYFIAPFLAALGLGLAWILRTNGCVRTELYQAL